MIAFEKRLEDVVSPLVHEAHRLWQSKRGTRHLPSRADFDPVEMPGLLSSMILVDVEIPETRLKVRLAGTKIVEMFGSDYTGKYLDEIEFGDVRSKILTEYKLCATEKRPLFSDHTFRKLNHYYHSIERVLLPLSNDDETVNMLMAVLEFERMDAGPLVCGPP